MKEAAKAAAPRTSHSAMPQNNAFLGSRMHAASFLNWDIFLRELMPQDLKLDPDRLTRDEATTAAHYLASVVGKAHGRQMDPTTQKKWRGELDRRRSKGLDAPSWLWTSVVELVASHEAAYLRHCREYAMKKSA